MLEGVERNVQCWQGSGDRSHQVWASPGSQGLFHINMDSSDAPNSHLTVILGTCCIHAHGGEGMKDPKPLKQHALSYTRPTTPKT